MIAPSVPLSHPGLSLMSATFVFSTLVTRIETPSRAGNVESYCLRVNWRAYQFCMAVFYLHLFQTIYIVYIQFAFHSCQAVVDGPGIPLSANIVLAGCLYREPLLWLRVRFVYALVHVCVVWRWMWMGRLLLYWLLFACSFYYYLVVFGMHCWGS